MTNNNDRAQLFLFYFVVIFLIAVFFLTPSLQLISILTLLNVLFLTPLVNFLQRKKINHVLAIFIVFAGAGVMVGMIISWLSSVTVSQWPVLVQSLPSFSYNLLQKINQIETLFRQKFHLQFEFGFSSFLSQAGSNSTSWLLTHATGLLSGIASATLLVPIFSFFILKDGEKYKTEI